MSFSCGIVGLPNVGKSTLFNAITKSSVDATNYPFCTIEPNHGVVAVPDDRIDLLSKLFNSKKAIYTTVDFTDIAGLVKGASKGEGLGNQFLGNIRQVDAIVQVVRVFEDADIIHEGPVSPLDDLAIINTELILADLETVQKKIAQSNKLIRSSNNKDAKTIKEIYERVEAHLSEEKLINQMEYTQLEWEMALRDCHFLTIKPFLIVANIAEDQIGQLDKNSGYKDLKEYCDSHHFGLIELSAKMEYDLAALDEESAKEYLEMLGLKESGLNNLIREAYKLLNLITFITTGEQETRAWTITKGATAPNAAGVIHTDFEKGFIKAEVIAYNDIVEYKTYAKCREAGKLRIEGKDYIIEDGDVCHFRFNV